MQRFNSFKTSRLVLGFFALSTVFLQAQELSSTVDSGDTAWVLTATALVLFMTMPGLALFYGGLVRARNVLSVMAQCAGIACMASLLWVAGLYSLAFKGDGGWIGNLDAAFLKGITPDTVAPGTKLPETLVRDVSDDLRDHHAGPLRRRGGGADEVRRDHDVFRAVAGSRLHAGDPLGVGRRLVAGHGGQGSGRRHRGPHHGRGHGSDAGDPSRKTPRISRASASSASIRAWCSSARRCCGSDGSASTRAASWRPTAAPA